jgi:hypothetical protein
MRPPPLDAVFNLFLDLPPVLHKLAAHQLEQRQPGQQHRPRTQPA